MIAIWRVSPADRARRYWASTAQQHKEDAVALTAEEKQEIIKTYATHEGDTGSRGPGCSADQAHR